MSERLASPLPILGLDFEMPETLWVAIDEGPRTLTFMGCYVDDEPFVSACKTLEDCLVFQLIVHRQGGYAGGEPTEKTFDDIERICRNYAVGVVLFDCEGKELGRRYFV